MAELVGGVAAVNKAAQLLEIFSVISKNSGYVVYHKKKLADARTAVGEVFSLASQLIQDCPAQQGFNAISSEWLVEVMRLIDKWIRLDKHMEERWKKLRADIKQLESAEWYNKESAPGTGSLGTGISKISNWHKVGRTSKTVTEEAQKLKRRYNHDLKKDHENRLYKPRQACCVFPHMKNMEEFLSFESRSETMDKIISSIYNRPSTQIYGAAGIGKTTMLVEIATQIEKENTFKSVVYVEVSRSPDVSQIQEKIANQLGVSLEDTSTNEIQDEKQRIQNRASKLIREIGNTRDETEKVLVVLDDVWEEFNIQEIGIPSDRKKVKLLIGTRKRNLPLEKDGNKIPLGLLSDDDSWKFFHEAANLGEKGDIIETAKKVKGECFELPLALAVIGRTLSGSTDSSEWENALTYLKKSEAEKLDPPRVEQKLCNIIKYSYEHLPFKIDQDIFKLCCLFPENNDVHEEDLKRYLIGEDVKLSSTEFVSSIHRLLNCYLLQRTSKPGILRMHAVVRDVGVYITRTENFAFINCGTGTASTEPAELSEETITSNKRVSVMGRNINATVGFEGKKMLNRIREVFVKEADGEAHSAKVQTLLLRKNTNLSVLPDTFFEKMKGLTVLDLSYSEISALPPSVMKLKNVRTLLLNGCKNLSDVKIIGRLKGLRVLSLRSALNSLPDRMSNLVELIVLDLSLAKEYKIDKGFFSSLPRLQELFLATETLEGDTFIEICKLKHITALRLLVNNVLLSSSAFENIQNLAEGCQFTIYSHSGHSLMSQQKNLHIKGLATANSGVKFLLEETEHLIIESCFHQATSSDLTKATGGSIFKKTKILHLTNCGNIKYLSFQGTSSSNLNELEVVHLTGLKEFMGIIQGTVSEGSFGKIREINVKSCENIVYVIPNNVLHKVHKTLEKITVINCVKVESIFHHDAGYSALFPLLTLIELQDLLILDTIWKGDIPQGTFSGLKALIVIECHKLNCVFTPDLAAMLTSLQILTVKNNNGLKAIVKWDDKSTFNEHAFPSVTHLTIQKLDKLQHFCERTPKLDLMWPSLVQLRLGGCDALTRFPIKKKSAPYMTRVDVTSKDDEAWPWYRELKELETTAASFKIRVGYNFTEQGA